MPQKKLVRCKVSLGFFETEFYVVVNASSAFVNRESVKVKETPSQNKEVDGEVFAFVVEERPEATLIELPGQAVVGSLRTWVETSNLVACH